MTVLEDYTFQYTDTGILLNTDATPDEPFVDISSVDGLDSAEFRQSERDREGMDGIILDAEFEASRTIVLEGTAYGNATTLESYMQRLKANFAPTRSPRPFYIGMPGVGTRVVFAKSLGCRYSWRSARRLGQSALQIVLKAEDPTMYGATLSTLTLPLQTATTLGRGYPRAYNYGYGGAGQVVGAISVYNEGDKPGPATLIIHGPIQQPTIYVDNQDKLMVFNITLGATEFLEVDLRNKTVRLNGSAYRRNVLIGQDVWWLLQPGANSIRFSGTQSEAPPPVASLDIIFRPAYR